MTASYIICIILALRAFCFWSFYIAVDSLRVFCDVKKSENCFKDLAGIIRMIKKSLLLNILLHFRIELILFHPAFAVEFQSLPSCKLKWNGRCHELFFCLVFHITRSRHVYAYFRKYLHGQIILFIY